MPVIDLFKNEVKSGTDSSDVVPSYGSCPAMALSKRAVSSTVLPIGPGESVEDAIATTPYRLQRP